MRNPSKNTLKRIARSGKTEPIADKKWLARKAFIDHKSDNHVKSALNIYFKRQEAFKRLGDFIIKLAESTTQSPQQ